MREREREEKRKIRNEKRLWMSEIECIEEGENEKLWKCLYILIISSLSLSFHSSPSHFLLNIKIKTDIEDRDFHDFQFFIHV